MSRIRSCNTKPEKVVRSILHKIGYRFRLHIRDIPGNPDIVMKKYKTIVFVHGCFWHRHEGCRYAFTPKSNCEYWENKFKENMDRDNQNYKRLKELGWNILIIWECEISDLEKIEEKLKTIKTLSI